MPKQPETTGGYLFITTRGYWKRLAAAGEWLFDSERAAAKLTKGDEAIVYLTAHGGESAIGGVVRVEGSVGPVSGDRLGLMHGIYPFRVPIKVVTICEPPIPFKSIRDRLSFIPKGPSWGGVLQGQPAKPIPSKDFDVLKDIVGGPRVTK